MESTTSKNSNSSSIMSFFQDENNKIEDSTNKKFWTSAKSERKI